MFLENESELCECRVTVFFGGISLRQPVWSFTPIAIFMWKFSFRFFNQSCKDFSPEDEKKIQQQQQQQQKQKKEKKEKQLNLWIYNVLKNMFIMLSS